MPPLIRLLRAARDGIHHLPLAAFDENQIQRVIASGLGPLLFQATKDDNSEATGVCHESLLSADLTARVLIGNLVDAMDEIIDATTEVGVRLTLLKGISICSQYYPSPHLRTMGDIDFLVPQQAYAAVESAILSLGYRRQSARSAWKDHHHGAPLFHQKRGVWVEIHTALFPQKAPVSRDRVFSPSSVTSQLHSSLFHGRLVNRLSDELQLVYIASYWAWDLSRRFTLAGSQIPLLDAMYLLNGSCGALNWDHILDWSADTLAGTYLYVMLSYLNKYELAEIPRDTLLHLASSQKIIGTIGLKVLHRVIDRHLMSGRPFGRILTAHNTNIVWDTLLSPGSSRRNLTLVPWYILFPPRSKARFSLRYQLGRIKRLLGPRRSV